MRDKAFESKAFRNETFENNAVGDNLVGSDPVDDVFEAAEPLFVRMASVPTSGVDTAGETGDANTAAGIARIVADPLLREAIRVASGSLSASLDKLDAGVDPGPKRLTGTALSVTRYALRLGGRPTPFGLFAGVGTARLGSATRVEIHGPGPKSARLDGGWLDAWVRDLLAVPQVRSRVDVVLDDRARIRDGRLVLPGPERETSVRRNALVAWVSDAAEWPVGYDRLLTRAAETFPETTPAKIEGLLAQLIRHGFLITSITPHRIDDALLDRIEAATTGLPAAAGRLRTIRTALSVYEKTEAGAGSPAWRRLNELVGADGEPAHPPIQVDLRMAADVALPAAVGAEARRYAGAMWAISADWVTHAHMREYRNRFVEKYGTDSAVRLAELVDPHRGLGFPAGYRGGGADPTTAKPAALCAERRALTAELVQEALLRDDLELRLTPDLVDRLAAATRDAADAGGGVGDEPPRSLEVCFQLLADNAAALDRGDFRLVATPHAGSWLAGAMAGRFAELTESTSSLSRLIRAGAETDGVLPAQVVFRPHTVRALNMIQVPRLLPHEIPVGVFADRSDPGCLDWRDLLVGVDEGGMRLTLAHTGQRVLPVVPHMLALDREAPEVVRLLVDIVFGRARTWTGWEWAGLETLPLLPRVTFGRVTVSPRRWVPDRTLRDAAADPRAWDRVLGAWRERYRVPDRVRIANVDRVYGIDLADPWHRTLLRHEVRRQGRFALFEDATEGGRGFGWADGHSTEIVVPMTRRRPPERGVRPTPRTTAVSPARSRLPRESAEPAYHLPGEDWLFAKLYATPDTHDELLRGHLAALLRDVRDDVDRWFFIRYADPEPHLRLRLHGDPTTLRTRVLPELARWARRMRDAGAIRSMLLDVYEPELARYGGGDAMPLAEALFEVDSASALALLRLRGAGRLAVPDEVLIAVEHVMLLESLGDWDWCSWVDYAFRPGPEQALFRQHRALARALIRPGRTAVTFAERFGAPVVSRLWTELPQPRAYGRIVLSDGGRAPARVDHDTAILGLLHMQHNRLLGIDRAREYRGHAILLGMARDHLGRAAHAGEAGSRG